MKIFLLGQISFYLIVNMMICPVITRQKTLWIKGQSRIPFLWSVQMVIWWLKTGVVLSFLTGTLCVCFSASSGKTLLLQVTATSLLTWSFSALRCPQNHLAMILICAFHFMYFIKVFLHFPGIAHILNFIALCAYICIYVYLIYVYIWVPRGIINCINLWHKISLSSSKIFLHAFIIHVYFYHSRSATKRRPHICSTLAIASVWLFPCSSDRGLVIEKLKTKKQTKKQQPILDIVVYIFSYKPLD